MRTFWIPLIVLPFGCAHETQTTAQNEPTTQPAATASAEPSPQLTEPAPPSQQATASQKQQTSSPENEQAMAPKEQSNLPSSCGLARIHFAFDSDQLTDDSKQALDQIANCLDKNQRLQVRVEGNTDERGSHEYNLDLGKRRARAVLGYLEGRGVSSEQLHGVSFGETRPLCEARDEDCFARNRRTAIRPTCRL